MEALTEELDLDSINDLNDKRIQELADAGIDEREVLANARENLTTWDGYFNENVTRGKDDMNFTLRDQWTAVERSEFNRLFKPAMTFNKIYDSVKKIAGEQRKNKPDLIVRSLTGRATQEQINLRADLVRTISYQSQNDLVYQTAFKQALLMGYGSFQVGIDYETPTSFNQVIRFDLIPDPTRSSFDPTALKPHKGDGNFCARQYIYTKEEFNATYPHIFNPVSYSDPRSLLDFQWETRDTIVVCDYYQKDWYSEIIYLLSNGMTVTKDEWEDLQKQFALRKELAREAIVVGGMIMEEIPKIMRERKTQNYQIRHYRLTQNQIIEFSDWPSKYLPIIFVDGDSNFVQGQQYTRSFVHEAKDAQKFINYVGSEIAAEIKNRRREQWIGTPDNILGYEQMWRNPELQNGILIAKPDPKTGQMPAKMPPWDLSPALLNQYQRGTMDIKEILGFYDENQGQQSNAISGVAIANRQYAGSMSAYVFFDNLNQAIEQAGRVVLDLLPTVYGGDERHIIVSKQDGKTASIILNKQLENGEITNTLEKGDYDIEIDTGPSFAVQKAASIQMMLQLCQANPQVFNLIADLIAKNLDLQFMPQIAERLQNMVPPQILAKEQGKELPPPQPSPQDQMMQQEIALREAQLKEREEELQIRKEKHELEKAKLALEAKKMSVDSHLNMVDKHVDMKKADMNYLTQMAKIISETQKHR